MGISLCFAIRIVAAIPRATPLQEGTSAREFSIDTSLHFTGVPTDLALRGNGYFVLRDPVSGEKFVTRYGRFRLDTEGHLMTIQGFRLQGFNTTLLVGGSYSRDSQFGDIKIDKGMLPSGLRASAAVAGIMNVFFAANGKILIVLQDDSVYIRGQVVVQDFKKPHLLTRRWQYLFDNLEKAEPVDRVEDRFLNGSLQVISGAIESVFPQDFPELLWERRGNETSVWIRSLSFNNPVLEASTDLISWSPISTNRNGQPQTFTDTATNRFYRVVGDYIYRTGVATDLAIVDEGYFVVRHPASNAMYVTRNGHFRIDPDGFLTTKDGLRVQGNPLTSKSGTDYDLNSPIGDIQINKGSIPESLPESAREAGLTNVSFDSNGLIQILLSDGSQYVRGRILLQRIGNPFALKLEANHLYSGIESADSLPQPSVVGDHGLGRIVSGSLERRTVN